MTELENEAETISEEAEEKPIPKIQGDEDEPLFPPPELSETGKKTWI